MVLKLNQFIIYLIKKSIHGSDAFVPIITVLAPHYFQFSATYNYPPI